MAEVHLRVVGGTNYVLRAEPLAALQTLAAAVEGGTALFRRFLRLVPGRGAQTLTPLAPRSQLQAVTKQPPIQDNSQIPRNVFMDRTGRELGRLYSHDDTAAAAAGGVRLAVDTTGIRVESDALPPPAGFRAGARDQGHYCHFRRLESSDDGWRGERIQPPGTGRLAHLPLPIVARWDAMAVAAPVPTALTHCLTAADAVYRDQLAVLSAACTEALRLPALLTVQRA